METTPPTSSPLAIPHAMLALEALLEPRRAAFKKRVRISMGFVEGQAYCIDTGAQQLISEQWSREADLSIITNQRTLSDMLTGDVDLGQPGPDHVLVWGGDRTLWRSLARSLSGRSSAFAAHLSSLRK